MRIWQRRISTISGTLEGGRKTALTNKRKYGEDFFKRIGRIGGRNSKTGGFASDKVGEDGLTGRERARIAGKKGGRKSTRLGVKNGEGQRANRDIDEVEELLEEERGRNQDVA